MSLPQCPRCQGQLLGYRDQLNCLQCGYQPSDQRPVTSSYRPRFKSLRYDLNYWSR